MKEAIDNLCKRFGLDSEFSQQLFGEKSAIKKLSKGVVIFGENQQNASEYILLDGLIHRYNNSEKGVMVTTGFYMDQAVITPHFARTSKGKSIFGLQCLTDAKLLEIPVSYMDNLRNSNEKFQLFGQKVIEADLSEKYMNEVVFRSYSAKERLCQLREQFPGIENRIPHAFISSYLGITNVSFSRLRKELSGR